MDKSYKCEFGQISKTDALNLQTKTRTDYQPGVFKLSLDRRHTFIYKQRYWLRTFKNNDGIKSGPCRYGCEKSI